MKRKDLQLLRKKGLSELVALARSKREELTLSYAKLKADKLKNTSALRNLRRDLAQILTLIKEKEILGKSSEVKK